MGSFKGGFGGGFGGFGGGANLQQLMKQAQKMQEDMEQAKEEIKSTEFVSNVAGGKVSVVMLGSRAIKSIKIDPEVVDKDDVEMLEDMIMAAINDVMAQIEKMETEKLPSIPGM